MQRQRFISYWLKPLVFSVSFLPAAWLIWAFISDQLGANPVDTILHHNGEWALRFLLITLSVTPLRRLSGWVPLTRLRRMLGLYCFFYAWLHLMTYLALDAGFDFAYIVEDVLDRLYISAGFLGFAILIPLAITSNRFLLLRLGPLRWRRLHRLVYVAAAAAILHFLWLVKADLREPLIYLGCFIVLMAVRLPAVRNWLSRPKKSAVAPH